LRIAGLGIATRGADSAHQSGSYTAKANAAGFRTDVLKSKNSRDGSYSRPAELLKRLKNQICRSGLHAQKSEQRQAAQFKKVCAGQFIFLHCEALSGLVLIPKGLNREIPARHVRPIPQQIISASFD
jgi:hypothetical protein